MRFALTLFVLTASLSVHAWDPGQDLKRAKGDVEKGLDHLKGEIENEPKKTLSRQFKPKALSHDLPADQIPGDDTFWMAVVGDSSVTGAVASPSFRATWERVGQLVGSFADGMRADSKMEARYQDFADPARFNVQNPPAPLTRVMFTPAEYQTYEKKNELHLLEFQSKGSQAVDTEEYAFPYLMGRALDIPAPQIVLTAQDGKKVVELGNQFDRILVTGAKTLPPVVLISFVANDLCHPDNFTKPPEHFADTYRADLNAQLDHVLTLPPNPHGTKLVFVAPLKVSEILSNPRLLDQPVKFENGDGVTCRQIHDGTGVRGEAAKKLQTMLIGACRGILKQGQDPDGQRRRLVDLQDAQFKILRQAVDDFGLKGREKNFSAQLATSTRDLELQTGDLANDCFHPSIRGHARIAETLLSELRGLKR